MRHAQQGHQNRKRLQNWSRIPTKILICTIVQGYGKWGKLGSAAFVNIRRMGQFHRSLRAKSLQAGAFRSKNRQMEASYLASKRLA